MQHTQIKTQKDAILWHLTTHGHITSWEAIKEYGCTRLASIIFNLKDEGHTIITHLDKKVNRFGRGVSIARYELLPQVGQTKLFT